MNDVLVSANHRKTIAILQMQRVDSKQLDIATHYTRNINTIGLAYTQRSKSLTI